MKSARVLVLLFVVLIVMAPCAAQIKKAKDHPGLHPVRDAKGKWGFIDQAGRFRIPPRFSDASEFSDGVAYVRLWEDGKRKNGFVDSSGKFKELPEVNSYEAFFHDGLARFQTPSGGETKYGYMDKSGRVVIAPQYFESGHFSEGLAWISVLKERKWLYGFIDKTGKIVIEPQFVYRPGDFVAGFAKVMGERKSGFVDKIGRFRLEIDHEKSDSFYSEGLLAAVSPGDPARGVYLDRNGKIVLEIPFWQQRTAWQRSLYTIRSQQLAPFSEGLAAVLSFNKIGFIDKTGRVVIEPEFRETNGFSEGLAAVKIIGSDGRYVWGYINRTGKLVIEPQFLISKPFQGGLARVTTIDGQDQLIDRTGKAVWREAN